MSVKRLAHSERSEAQTLTYFAISCQDKANLLQFSFTLITDTSKPLSFRKFKYRKLSFEVFKSPRNKKVQQFKYIFWGNILVFSTKHWYRSDFQFLQYDVTEWKSDSLNHPRLNKERGYWLLRVSLKKKIGETQKAGSDTDDHNGGESDLVWTKKFTSKVFCGWFRLVKCNRSDKASAIGWFFRDILLHLCRTWDRGVISALQRKQNVTYRVKCP